MSSPIRGKKTNARKNPGARGRRPDLKKFRQEEARVRQEEYDKLSLKEKLERLVERLSVGSRGEARRQRAKLEAAIAEQSSRRSK